MAFLVGHLLGDFMFQNDWMASRKNVSTWHCLVHVLIYSTIVTLCVHLYHGASSPRLFLLIAVPHFIIDRFGLPRRWMRFYGQNYFAVGPMSPWSIVAVDQAMHAGCLLAAAIINP